MHLKTRNFILTFSILMKMNFLNMKNFSSITFLILLLFITSQVKAQSFPKMDTSPMDLSLARTERDGPPIARVIYSRPQKKGRDIFGDLVPYGEIWRTGANEATELEIYRPLMFGKTLLKPGTYTLYTIPGEDKWTIIINSDTNVWGAFSYKQDKDVGRMTVKRHFPAAPIESLSMIFRPDSDGTTLLIGWDNEYVEVPFKYAP